MERDNNKTMTTNLCLLFMHWSSLADYLSIRVAHLPNWVVSSFQLQHLRAFLCTNCQKSLAVYSSQRTKWRFFFFFFNTQRKDLFPSFVKALTEKRIITQRKWKRGKCCEGVENSSRERMSCSNPGSTRGR